MFILSFKLVDALNELTIEFVKFYSYMVLCTIGWSTPCHESYFLIRNTLVAILWHYLEICLSHQYIVF